MHKSVLAPDRVLLLLAVIPYLREHGPTPVVELARTFDVAPQLLRDLIRFLGTAGIPGETLTYQHEDLFDIDWEALEEQDTASLIRTVAVDETPRFSATETAALLAGLQTLRPLLPEDDARAAEALAARLGDALGSGSTALSASLEPQDPRIPMLVEAIGAGRRIAFSYRDAAGRSSSRDVDPLEVVQRGDTWYLRGFCHDRGAERTFRLDQMSSISDAGERTSEGVTEDPSSNPQKESRLVTSAEPITARVTGRALARIAEFDPEPLSVEAGGDRIVRVEAWHGGTPILLLQRAPGEITILHPDSARETARRWAEQALAAYGE